MGCEWLMLLIIRFMGIKYKKKKSGFGFVLIVGELGVMEMKIIP